MRISISLFEIIPNFDRLEKVNFDEENHAVHTMESGTTCPNHRNKICNEC